jgi:transposase
MAVVRVIQACRFALEPSPPQERMLRSHGGAARFAWNWGLAKCTERYAAEGKWYSAIDLHRLWNAAKKADPALAWWDENSKCAYQTIIAEDLNVTGMLANRRLARAVADQGFGTARRMLNYKAPWNGGRLLVADRWYPSSKTCSACGWRKPSLTLAERIFICEACGLVMDRDVNAARNLLGLAASGAESIIACGAQVRPVLDGHRAVKQDPGTADAGTAETAGPHGPAAGQELPYAY